MDEYFSDLVFEVDLHETKTNGQVDIVLLFEHKSSPDKHVLFQVGYYMFAHYIKVIRRKEGLKPLVPVIYYQGSRKWEAPTLSEIFEDYPSNVKGYLPVINHIFVALRSLPNETLLSIKNSLMASAMIAQKWRNNPTTIAEEIAKIFSLFDEEINDRNFFEMTFIYILKASKLELEMIKEVIDTIPPKAKDQVMTTYSKIIEQGKIEGEQIGMQKGEQIGMQKGEQIGMQKGEQIGIKKGKIEVVLKSHDQDLPISVIADITGLTLSDIESILEEHNNNH